MYTTDTVQAVQILLQRPNIIYSVLKILLRVIIHVYGVVKLLDMGAWNYQLLIPKHVLLQVFKFTFPCFILYDGDSKLQSTLLKKTGSNFSITRKLSLQLLAVLFLGSVFIDTCIFFKWFGASLSFTRVCKT